MLKTANPKHITNTTAATRTTPTYPPVPLPHLILDKCQLVGAELNPSR